MKVAQYKIGIQKEKPFFSLAPLRELLTFAKGHEIKHLSSITHFDSKGSGICCYTIVKARQGLISANVIDIYVFDEASKVPAFALLQLILRYRAVRVNIFRKSSRISSNRVWLVKNSSEEGLFISPVSSELHIPR